MSHPIRLDHRPLARLPSLFFSTCVVACGAVYNVQAVAGPLSPVEQRIAADVRARSGEAIRLLEESVNINSGTMNHAGVRAVGARHRAEFEQMGFKTRWIDLPPAMRRAGHLVATREGKQGKRLLLLGHLDTVFEADSPVKKWERKGASGIQLVQELSSTTSKVRGVKCEGDKVMRLMAQTAAIENGFVLFPKDAPWLREYLNELLAFPMAKYDDQVDSTAQALKFVASYEELATYVKLVRPY